MKSYLKTEEEYLQVMERIEAYLTQATASGGFHHLSDLEKDDLRRLSLLAEHYEDGVPLMPIRQPQNLPDMIALKMYERKLKQKDLAALLGISAARLSEVLSGKRKVTLELAKRLHSELGIDPAFILETA
jgi:HTH-type transcriptional regulator/antitoxin HigA